MNQIAINVINRLLSQMDLFYDEEQDELYYILDYYHSNIKVFITAGIADVITLLGLPDDFGQNTIHDYHLLANSKYFTWKVLKKNKYEIRPFLDVLKDFNYESSYYTKNKLDVMYELKTTLKMDCSSLLSMYRPDDLDMGKIRNKYNGHLVNNWLRIPKSPNILDRFTVEYSMGLFKKHIEEEICDKFIFYLYSTSAKDIRANFLTFITNRNAWYWQFDNKLPF